MPPVLAQFLVMQPAELMRVVVEPVCGALHLVEVMAVVASGRLFLAPFPDDVQFFVAELHDLRQGLLKVHPIVPFSGFSIVGSQACGAPAHPTAEPVCQSSFDGWKADHALMAHLIVVHAPCARPGDFSGCS
jgi:hypothetical protein